jgi:hypothetical protein
MRTAAGLIFSVTLVGLAGCATDSSTASQEARSTPSYRTGSMLPKKDGSSADVQTVDPQAVRDALGGKPTGQGSGGRP